jgi:hypothetical protein
MRVLSGSTWAGGVVLVAAAAVACGPNVTVDPGTGSGGATASATATVVSSSGVGGIPTTGTGVGGLCGDGIVEPSDHCDDPSSDFYCNADCLPGMTAATVGASSSASSGGGCVGHVYYAGKVDNAPSVWANLPGSVGMTSLAAGNAACVGLEIGAEHVCDYEEVLQAVAHGELSFIPQGTTAWVQRTTTALVNGMPSAPGSGGRCHDWTYAGNNQADGEYATFDQPGLPTFHLDGDTIFDPSMPGVHQIPGDLQCGGTMRSILCCYQVCM